MQKSRFYTGISKWRERLGIEPNRLITIFEFREKVTILVRLFTPIIENPQTKNPVTWRGLMSY